MKKLHSALLAAVLSVGLVAVTATPAQAAPGCALGRFCVHETGTSNPFWGVTDAQAPIGTCKTVSPQRLTRHVTNNSFSNYRVYLTGSCTGTPGFIYQNSAGPMNAYWTDRIRGVIRQPQA